MAFLFVIAFGLTCAIATSMLVLMPVYVIVELAEHHLGLGWYLVPIITVVPICFGIWSRTLRDALDKFLSN